MFFTRKKNPNTKHFKAFKKTPKHNINNFLTLSSTDQYSDEVLFKHFDYDALTEEHEAENNHTSLKCWQNHDKNVLNFECVMFATKAQVPRRTGKGIYVYACVYSQQHFKSE